MRAVKLSGAIRILIVDDEERMAETIAEIVVEKIFPNASVKLAFSPDSAIEALQNSRYDIVISDHQMNGRSGIEIFEFIQSRGDDTHFIMFTGNPFPSEDFLVVGKPNLSELVAGIYQVTTGRTVDFQHR